MRRGRPRARSTAGEQRLVTRGAVKKLYRLYGPCSHNPGIYFDPEGTQTEIIPEKPIEPGSEEAKAFQAKHDKQVGGLTKAESISCR